MGSQAIHVTAERINGSKSLQLLTGTHFSTYWLSNYLFDMCVCLFNVCTIILSIKVVDAAKNDPTSELSPIVTGDAFIITFILFLASSWSWCAFAYCSSLIFQSDIVAFIGVFLIASVAAFMDMICSLVYLFVKLDKQGKDSFTSTLMDFIRYLLAICFPNVTIKRALYNIKIKDNDYCLNSLNSILNTGYSTEETYLSLKEPGIGMLLVFTFVIIFIDLILISKKI